MSTMVMPASAPKKLSSRVLPGVFDVRASAFWPTNALISDDLPTFERPAKATSMPADGGKDAADPLPARNRHGLAKRRRPASMALASSSFLSDPTQPVLRGGAFTRRR